MLEAPTAGSVLLGWYFVKNGGGMVYSDLLVPLFPLGTLRYFPVVFLVHIVGVNVVVLYQLLDNLTLRRTIAYSSVSHMGLINLGIFSELIVRLPRLQCYLWSHTVLVSSGLFISVGLAL